MTAPDSFGVVTWVFEGQPHAVQVESVVSVPIIEVRYIYEAVYQIRRTLDGTPILDENGQEIVDVFEIIVGQDDVLVGYEYETVLIDSWADGSVWPGACRDILWWSPLAGTAEIVARIAPPRLTARLQERHLDLHVRAVERSTP